MKKEIDLHDIWPHRWINPKAKPDKSKIHGTGMFAIGDIKKDEAVAVYGGIIVPTSDIEKHRRLIGGVRCIQLDEDFFICATEKKGGLFNHSCDNNLGYGSTIKIIAIKDIKAGEELVHDYALTESEFKPWKCNCGTKNCRKVIKPADWKNPELHKKCGEYFTPYLKNKFKELNENQT